MAYRRTNDAARVIREIDAMNRLALALLKAGRRAGLHRQDPFRPVPPPPRDVYYDPADLDLAARLAGPVRRHGRAVGADADSRP